MHWLILLLALTFSKSIPAQIIGDTLPDPPYRVLFSKKIPNILPFFAFNGDLIGLSSNKRISIVDIGTGSTKFMQTAESQYDLSDALPIVVEQDGVYVYRSNQIFFTSQDGLPKQVWKAKDRIRWTESKPSYAIFITESGEVGVLEKGKVTVIENAPTGGLFPHLGGIEVRDTTDSGTWIKLYDRAHEKVSCNIPGLKLMKAGLSQDGLRAYGLESQNHNALYQHFVAYDCIKKKEIWRRSIYKDIFKGYWAEGMDYGKGYQHSVFGTATTCGGFICLNILTEATFIGGTGASGVYCLEQISGELAWADGINLKEGISTGRVSTLMCLNSRLISFSNFSPFISTQTFPIRVDKSLSLLDDPSRRLIASLVDLDYYITNLEIFPRIVAGRIAFIGGDGNLIVLGK